MQSKRAEGGPFPTRAEHVRLNLMAIGALPFVARVCLEYGVTLESVLGGRRSRTATLARRHVWTVLRHTLDLSYAEVADLFFSDFSSVWGAVKRRERELEELYA